jgi:TM2 domain-containing membrane protein YozV
MNSATRCCILFILAALGICANAQSVLQKQFELAEELYNKEKYFDAITELRRLNFFDVNNDYAFQSNELIALSYKNGGKYQEAIEYFTLAELRAEDIDDLYKVSIAKVKINILRHTTDNALKLLDVLEKDERFSDKTDDLNYWEGWAYIFADDWEAAAKSFAEINPGHELKMFCEKTDEQMYSPAFAKIASVFLPGAGQFYTGNYISGLLSLGWTALWGYLAVNAFVEDRVFDGLAVANFLWFRFYRGNLQNAENFALERNLQITNEALNYLQHDYKGLKP